MDNNIQPFALDYNLTTVDERLDLLTQLPLESCTPAMLENCANYVLHLADKSLSNAKALSKVEGKRNLQLNENSDDPTEIKPRKGSNAYLYPVTPIDWNHPNLSSLATQISHLLLASEMAEGKTAYQLKRWVVELRLDAKARLPQHTMSTHPTMGIKPEIDIEMAGLDWTNSFHIKHLVRYYSQLRQSEHSKWAMEYFEKIVDRTPMPDWQRHLFIRYVDGAHSIVIAREVAEDYGKILYPGYTSKIMRQIYRSIAEEAERMDVERELASKPKRVCPKCGESFPNHDFWWRKGQRACKQCLRK